VTGSNPRLLQWSPVEDGEGDRNEQQHDLVEWARYRQEPESRKPTEQPWNPLVGGTKAGGADQTPEEAEHAVTLPRARAPRQSMRVQAPDSATVNALGG
jgi:hypothetical protein